MFMNRDLSHEERERIREERRRKRQEFFKTLGFTLEKLLGDVISSARDILFPGDSLISNFLSKPTQKEKAVLLSHTLSSIPPHLL